MPLGLLDLSAVTDRLVAQLKSCADNSKLWDADPASKFTINCTGLAPEEARTADDEGVCQLSIYLVHVAGDVFHRNTYPLGGPAQTNAHQPFAVILYYLVTAHAMGSYIREQQAMSVALKCFHENPIVRSTVTTGDEDEFTVTIEPQTIDEIGRLWQAVAAPMRLSAIYRVSVIFLEAPTPPAADVVRHAPDFRPPNDVDSLETAPPAPTFPGAIVHASASTAGLATIRVADAGFVAGKTEVRIRARPLNPTTTRPLGGEFQVVDAETLIVRVPLYTPQGRYVVTARPDPLELRVIEIELDVPEPIVTVEVQAGLVSVVIDDAGFAAGVTTARIDEQTGTALVEVNAEPLGTGQFLVVGPQALRLRIPGGTPSGRHLLTLGRGPERADLELWLAVP